jgi:hypothetical protein
MSPSLSWKLEPLAWSSTGPARPPDDSCPSIGRLALPCHRQLSDLRASGAMGYPGSSEDRGARPVVPGPLHGKLPEPRLQLHGTSGRRHRVRLQYFPLAGRPGGRLGAVHRRSTGGRHRVHLRRQDPGQGHVGVGGANEPAGAPSKAPTGSTASASRSRTSPATWLCGPSCPHGPLGTPTPMSIGRLRPSAVSGFPRRGRR